VPGQNATGKVVGVPPMRRVAKKLTSGNARGEGHGRGREEKKFGKEPMSPKGPRPWSDRGKVKK